MNLLTHGGLGLLRDKRDGQVRGALANPRRATHGARAVALEGRALVRVDREDPHLLAHEVVIVLRVGDGGLEQLRPGLGRLTRGEGEDRASLLDVLAADVIADEPRLAGGRAHVLGLGGDLQPDRRGRLAGLLRLLAATATAANAARGFFASPGGPSALPAAR